jgi:hypothetical protein
MARNGIVFNNAKISLAAAFTKIKIVVNLSAAVVFHQKEWFLLVRISRRCIILVSSLFCSMYN